MKTLIRFIALLWTFTWFFLFGGKLLEVTALKSHMSKQLP